MDPDQITEYGDRIAYYVQQVLVTRYLEVVAKENFPFTPELSLELDNIEKALRIISNEHPLCTIFDDASTTVHFGANRYVHISHSGSPPNRPPFPKGITVTSDK